MNDQIELLENSLRTNIVMAKAMCKLKHNELAKRYLKRAKSDKKMLDIAKRNWDLDATREFNME